MKNRFINRLTRVSTALLMSTCFIFTSCNDDDITVKVLDEGQYEVSADLKGYVIDGNGKRKFTNIEFRNEGSTSFHLNLSQKADKNQTVKMVYDAEVLKQHNDRFDTMYEAFPESQVTFENDGQITIKSGEQKSEAIAMSYTSDGTLTPNKSYVIPVKLVVSEGNVILNESDATKLIFIKDITAIPDCNKESGIKVFSCMEVNDTNPLNNLSFTLAESGKPLVDVLILFSANINYNAETGRVYIFNNENVQAILDNREKYLKPLQDRGIKIVLGLLGNHDRAGVANLADHTAKEFAKEVKAVCDAYHLDGIFVDDEYSNYMSPPPPGFVSPSNAAAARLCYEVKMAQPDRMVVAYAYSRTYGFPSIEGLLAGEYTDYALHDYGGSSDLTGSYPGMPKMNQGLYSQEYSQGRFASESNLVKMRGNGYGSHMIFAMDPNRANFSRQLNSMKSIARAFYDEELVFDGIKYAKDW